MKYLFFMFSFFTAFFCKAQLTIIPNHLDNYSQKAQLWDLSITNASSIEHRNVYINLTFIDKETGNPMFVAKTGTFNINSSSMKRYNYLFFSPIEYVNLTSWNGANLNSNGLLPTGNFDMCFQILKFSGDKLETMVEQCEQIEISPLAPPSLISPSNETKIGDDFNNQFSWSYPITTDGSINSTFEIKIVELFSNQSPEEALEMNAIFFMQKNISTNSLVYNNAIRNFKISKKYAWQITSFSKTRGTGKSEIWVFEKKNNETNKGEAQQSFYKMQPIINNYQLLVGDEIKLEYENYLNDTICKIEIFEVAGLQIERNVYSNVKISLKSGTNAIILKKTELENIKTNKTYLLKLINSRNEEWFMKFNVKK